MKFRYREIFLMFIEGFLGFSIPFGVYLYCIYWNVLKAMILGIYAGLLYGLGVVIYCCIQMWKNRHYYKSFLETHNVIYNASANHYYSKHRVAGGWIFITDSEIVFKPHGFDKNLGEINIPMNSILDIKKEGILTAILIKTNKNINYKFVVNHRNFFIKIIKENIEKKQADL